MQPLRLALGALGLLAWGCSGATEPSAPAPQAADPAKVEAAAAAEGAAGDKSAIVDPNALPDSAK